jgi:gamma-glutamylcyclotransferase (GGCT)/AIG2-like uncharacterized protein YtfP
MSAAPEQIFVYGSLRSGFQNPAYQYISQYFSLVGNAKVKGRLYHMGNFPAAQPCNEEIYIIGELYAAKNNDEFAWAISQLDDYEGIHTEEGETEYYKRQQTTVYINGQTTNAWIYWYAQPITDKPSIASGDIFDFVQQKND